MLKLDSIAMNVSCVVSTHQKYGEYFHSTIFPQLSRIFAQLFTTQMTQSLLNYVTYYWLYVETRSARLPATAACNRTGGPRPKCCKNIALSMKCLLANQFVKTCALKSGSQRQNNTIQNRAEECALASLVQRTRPEGLPTGIMTSCCRTSIVLAAVVVAQLLLLTVEAAGPFTDFVSAAASIS